MEQRRASLLVQHLLQTKQHSLQSSSFSAWQRVTEDAEAEAAFILHSLSTAEKALMQAAVVAWRDRALQLKRLQALRYVMCPYAAHM